jgi:DNA-binding response OmpR family regulator
MDEPTILVVEDDDAIATGLVRVLEGQGYSVRRIARGSGAVREAEPPVGLVILDLGLPDVDGLDVCRRIRAARPEISILILTARDQELDIVAGLDGGADDYLVKPFRLSELLARIRSRLRRAPAPEAQDEAPLVLGALRIDRPARRVWLGEEELTLRPKEFELLTLFASNPGVALTRARIMESVWETSWLGSTKTLDTHVLALRNKLGADAITTLRGVGYRFDLR